MATRFHTSYPRVNDKYRRSLHTNLLRWYKKNRRDLPWRRTADPYKIWISEIMLQQTRVEVVCEYYHRWMNAFPSVQSLATAPSSQVLKLWEGLGYYNRARNLHRAAKIISLDLKGRFPKSSAELNNLPGVGRYTAGAIASIAFGEKTAAVDGNVLRVFSRLFRIHDDISKESTRLKFWSLAEKLLPYKETGTFNQALMEIGALICTPKNPCCLICPLVNLCRAFSSKCVSSLPIRGNKSKPIRLSFVVAFVISRSRVLLQQRPSTGLLADFWELPLFHPSQFNKIRPLGSIRFSITNMLGTLNIIECSRLGSPRVSLPLRWFLPRELETYPISSAHRKALRLCFSVNSTALALARREKARSP